MLKIVSENFIHALLLFLGLFLKISRWVPLGVYQLFDPATNSMYEVFCDIDSEKRFVWTLIESLSLRNNNKFSDKAFYQNYPINQKEFAWSKFRLSRALMMATANNSTHVRATCNFDSEKRNYRDYLRAKLSELNVMNFNSIQCKKFEFVIAFEDITVTTAQPFLANLIKCMHSPVFFFVCFFFFAKSGGIYLRPQRGF